MEAWQSLKDTYDESSSVSSKIQISFSLFCSFFALPSLCLGSSSSLFVRSFLFFLFPISLLTDERRRQVKGGGGGTGPLPRFFLARWHWNTKKKKKKILAMREILLLPRRKSSKSTGRDPRGGNCSMYVEKYVVSWVKLGTIRASVFPLWRSSRIIYRDCWTDCRYLVFNEHVIRIFTDNWLFLTSTIFKEILNYPIRIYLTENIYVIILKIINFIQVFIRIRDYAKNFLVLRCNRSNRNR